MFARMPVISCTLKEFISFDGYPLSPKKSRHASLVMAEERHAQLLTWREQHQRVLTLQDDARISAKRLRCVASRSNRHAHGHRARARWGQSPRMSAASPKIAATAIPRHPL